MSMYPQARSQSERPDPAGASRTGGAPLRKFTGTSLPNGKVSDQTASNLKFRRKMREWAKYTPHAQDAENTDSACPASESRA